MIGQWCAGCSIPLKKNDFSDREQDDPADLHKLFLWLVVVWVEAVAVWAEAVAG